MPTQYLTKWTELKTKFESDAGKKIAAIEKKKLVKQKVSELREKDGVVRLKKPAETFLGFRKDSGIETACKALDKATAADVDMKTRTKALSTYRTAEGKYIEVLLNAAKEEPYSLVTKEIDALRKGMQQIAADFNKNYTQAKPRAPTNLATGIKTLESLIKELAASKTFLSKTSIEGPTGVLASRIKTIAAHLKKLRSDTVSQLLRVYDDLGYDTEKSLNLNKTLLKALERLLIEEKLVAASKDDEEPLNTLKGKDSVEKLLTAVTEQIGNAINDAKQCINFAQLIK
jgi:hypothetical protein